VRWFEPIRTRRSPGGERPRDDILHHKTGVLDGASHPMTSAQRADDDEGRTWSKDAVDGLPNLDAGQLVPGL
jgi:hypothetical protein